jgi:hypothetical protein
MGTSCLPTNPHHHPALKRGHKRAFWSARNPLPQLPDGEPGQSGHNAYETIELATETGSFSILGTRQFQSRRSKQGRKTSSGKWGFAVDFGPFDPPFYPCRLLAWLSFKQDQRMSTLASQQNKIFENVDQLSWAGRAQRRRK